MKELGEAFEVVESLCALEIDVIRERTSVQHRGDGCGDDGKCCLNHPFRHRPCNSIGAHISRADDCLFGVIILDEPVPWIQGEVVRARPAHEAVPPEIHTTFDAESGVFQAEGNKTSDMGSRVTDRHAVLVDDQHAKLYPDGSGDRVEKVNGRSGS